MQNIKPKLISATYSSYAIAIVPLLTNDKTHLNDVKFIKIEFEVNTQK